MVQPSSWKTPVTWCRRRSSARCAGRCPGWRRSPRPASSHITRIAVRVRSPSRSSLSEAQLLDVLLAVHGDQLLAAGDHRQRQAARRIVLVRGHDVAGGVGAVAGDQLHAGQRVAARPGRPWGCCATAVGPIPLLAQRGVVPHPQASPWSRRPSGSSSSKSEYFMWLPIERTDQRLVRSAMTSSRRACSTSRSTSGGLSRLLRHEPVEAQPEAGSGPPARSPAGS